MNELKRLGKEFADIEDRALDQDDSLEKAKKLFIQRIAEEREHTLTSTGRRSLWVPALIGAAAAACIIFGMMLLPSDIPSDNEVPVGNWLKAPANKELSIDFPKGDRIVFSPGSEGRIASSSDEGAIVVLERGLATVSVVPRKNNEWRINAGPYEIQVVGTKFDVAWHPDTTSLEITMLKGEILVSGPFIPEGQRVRAEQVFTASVVNGNMTLSSTKESSDNNVLVEHQTMARGLGSRGEANRPGIELERTDVPQDGNTENFAYDKHQNVQDVKKSGRRGNNSAWLSKASAGNYSEAISIVVDRGLAKTLAQSNAKELLLLGDAARLTKNIEIAQKAYLEMRKRYKGSGLSSNAALMMGRMAFDQRRDYRDAIRWLEIYLSEQPNSSLRREALGRILEAKNRSGKKQSARQTARDYLESYPNGPHAATAKDILNEAIPRKPINNQ